MKKKRMETTIGRIIYLRPQIAWVTSDEPCMRFYSWEPQTGVEPTLPVEEEEDDEIPDEPLGAKSYAIWDDEFYDEEDDYYGDY